MITITLTMISEGNPCKPGWQKLLHSKKGWRSKRSNEPFPLTDVLDSNGIIDAAWCTGCLRNHKELWDQFGRYCIQQIPKKQRTYIHEAYLWTIVRDVLYLKARILNAQNYNIQLLELEEQVEKQLTNEFRKLIT